MKFKLFVVLIIAVIALAIPTKSTYAQYNNAISANPIGLAFGLFNATYETRVSANNSFTVSGYYWKLLDWTAFGFGGSYRWYLKLLTDNKKPLEGLSAGPAIALGFWKWDGPYGSLVYDGGTSIAIGGEVAYKWVFDGFVVEPIINIMFNVASLSGLTYQPFGAGVNLGYAWQ
ncbi:MAG: hypothetical protein HZB41_08310 [Ignavibacteriae bacterium]|nr:hypothetical protein [Ignavibacteriota bacterium]